METLRAESTIRGLSSDVEMLDAETPSESMSANRFIVAVDFGTTFSSVSFLMLPKDSGTNCDLNPHIYRHKIKSITNYPNEPSRRKEVPTEIWYPDRASLETLLGLGNGSNEMTATDDSDDDQIDNRGQVLDADVNMDTDDSSDDERDENIFWGYKVQSLAEAPDTNRNKNRPMSRFKLLLDDGDLTRQVRLDLESNLKELKRKKMIKDKEDIIGNYLEHLFKHAKKQLKKSHDFSSKSLVEFVLCIPPIWTPKACRIMQKNMERAIRKSKFGKVVNDSVDNLFIVSEPEAAAAYVLESNAIVFPKETFVLIDAGGGTVDAITYTVDNNYPLRLKEEGVEPGGDLCGSSYLNEAFREHLLARLQGEDYLEVSNITIESLVDPLVVKFENERKRDIDVTVIAKHLPIIIHNLRPNKDPAKRFADHRVIIETSDLRKIFVPLLEKVAALMKVQLEGAKDKALNVKKVILIGGFANSPSLVSYLKKELAGMQNYKGDKIRLKVPIAAETAVSSGAVLRALNKKNGPQRISRSSYGFLCSEVHDPDEYPAHREVRPFNEPLDGRKYVKNTIYWLISKGDEIPAEREYSMPVFYIFDAEEGTRFECEEFLWVSDSKMESHYRKNHENNKGATLIGKIETNMTFLKEQNLVQPVEAEEGVRAKRHYKIEYELVMIVNDRNMRWEARYPAGGQVQGTGQVSIAAAFVPGTK